ncbi:MAG TPA: O-antigen ligase family protein [Candidatus Omnitrophota bacterium]|nr:O-antigen ligase family protein [Candidatus Omnitrophota bacterium]
MVSPLELNLPLLALALVIGLSIAFITSVNVNFSLILLIVSMLFSPEIPLARLSNRMVVLRLDDIILIFLFFTWFARMAINKQLGLFAKNPVTRPLSFYVLAYVLATFAGIFFGLGKARFTTAFFYLLKYTEYLMLFVLVSNNIKSLKQCKMFTVFLLITAFFVCIYGYIQIYSGVNRASAPFEGLKTEPNTLAGYLVVIMGLSGGLLIHANSFKKRFLLSIFLLLIFPVFLYTLSRGGYISFMAMYFVFILTSKKKKIVMVYLIFVMILALPFILPAKVATRIEKTFKGKSTYEVMGERLSLDEASAARIETWKYVLDVFKRSPVFGFGASGTEFIDTQYGTVLAETGIFGAVAFLALLSALFKNSLRIYRGARDDFLEAISLGFFCALSGVVVMGFGANSFVIVRIMEPLLFLGAMVFAGSQVISGKTIKEDVLGT